MNPKSILILVLLAATAICAHAQTGSANELRVGAALTGNIAAGESYTYTVRTAARGLLVVQTTGSTDTFLHAFNSANAEIATDDDSGTRLNARIELMVNANEVYSFSVRGVGSRTTGPYEISAILSELDTGSDLFITRNNAGITITRYNGTRQTINIPSTIQGLSVIAIDYKAFHEKQLTSVTIPNGVTSIGDEAFYGNRLTSVTIPNSVTTIGAMAFSGNQLTSVTIPNSVTVIGDWAFSENKITSINIPNSIAKIGEGVFETNQLTSVTIPNSVTSIGYGAFWKNQLTSVTIPNSVTSIGINVFRGNQLTSVTIPNSVTTIGNLAFAENRLTSVSIPNSVTTIGTLAFASNKLTSVTIPNSVTTIGDRAFTVNELTGTITIPNSVTSIGGWSFCCNPNLRTINVSSANPNYSSTDGVLYSKNGSALILWPGGKSGAVTIPGGVTSIGKGAFCGNNFTSIYIPNNVTAIEDGAFAGNQFTRVTLPANVNIADNAFEGEIAKLYKDNGRTAFHYENGFIARIRPPQNNPKQADLMIGSAVFQELQIARFLNDTAAVSRNETVLNLITGRGEATRAEIEAFYRNNIRAQIEGVVDRELITGKSVNNDTRRVINEIITTPLTNFYLSPTQANFDRLKRNHIVLGQIINKRDFDVTSINLRQNREAELQYGMFTSGLIDFNGLQRLANNSQLLRQIVNEIINQRNRIASRELGITITGSVEWEKIQITSAINALNSDLTRMVRQ